MAYPVLGMVRRGDTIYQYHVAYDQSHGLMRKNNPAGVIRWTAQRLDGFVSADADYAGGEMITQPFTFEGSRLELNLDARTGGEARVEIQDAAGAPLPGHALTDCQRILGNHIRYPVRWCGQETIAAPPGRPIRLRFAMRGIKLYALRFVDAGRRT